MKVFTLLGVVIIAATALSACGGGSSSTGNTNTPTPQTPNTPAVVTDTGLIIDSGRGIINNE